MSRLRTFHFPHLLLASLLCFAGCAGKKAPAGSVDGLASETSSGINELVDISIEDRGEFTTVVVSGSRPMSPNIFKLTDPHRIIIDLTDTTLGAVEGPIEVRQGGINEITVSQFDDAASSLSRVVVGLEDSLDYQVESDGNQLMVNVVKVASGFVASEEGLPSAPVGMEAVDEAPEEIGVMEEVSPLEAFPPAEDATLGQEGIEQEAMAAVEAGSFGMAAEEAVGATELVDVQYFSGDSGTTIRLIGNGRIGQFEDLVLQDPSRLVIDLPGVKNAYPGGDLVPLGTPEVEQVRLGGEPDRARIVLDAVSTRKPLYTIDQDDTALVITMAAENSAVPGEETAEAVQAEAEFIAAEEPAMEEAVAVSPYVEPIAPDPISINGLGFKQFDEENKSRIIIGLSEPTSDYRILEEGPGGFTLEVMNSRLERRILKREFDTREFRTAILSIAPSSNRSAGSTSFRVELEQQVPYNVSQEGNSLLIDVNVPDQVLRKQQETPRQETAAAPLPPAVEAENAEPVIENQPEEKMLEAELPSEPEKVEDLRPKNYRYVQEGFMSDSAATAAPLSAMGSILAGEFQGKKFTGRKISLDFKNADIRSIFRLLADISKLNLIISDDVKGNVTVRLENVPWDQAFAIILQTKGLWFEKYGNIVRIARAEKLRAERELAAAARRASVAAKPLDVLFKPVSYADAATLTKQVQSVLTNRGTVDIDSRTNTLIIKDIRENLEKAKKMVDILDTQTPQVTIEARIVEANTNYTRSFGIIWGGQARFTPATGNPTGVFFPNSADVVGGAGGLGQSFSGLPVALNYPSPLGVNSGVGIRLGSINNILDLDLALGLLETQGNAKIISTPKITVMDNESASIQAGSKIPFLTQTANAGSNVRFESATTSLSVTPHITNDGSISMLINATRNEPNFAQLVQGNPLVDQRTASTKVLVKSGNTTVLGGIYSIRTGTTRDSLPYVSKIPIIGWLFRNWAKELRRSELLIFVTPRIVGDEREAVRDVRG